MVCMEPIEKAILEAGGLTALATSLDVVPQVVNNWRSRVVPVDRCIDIEKATNGAVRCEELRPDVDWAYLRNGCEE